MMFERRLFCGGILAAASPRAMAQALFPDHPIRMVVAFAAGGPTDVIARRIGERMSGLIGQPIIVENRTGASGTIGAAEVARARSDGYTLLVAVSSSHSIAAKIMVRPGFHPIDDFAGIGILCLVPIGIAVNPAFPAANLQELIARVRDEPGCHSFSTSGNGGISHLAAELFMQKTGLRMNHIPYRGAGPGLQDVMAGRVPIYIDAVSNAVEAHRTGRVRMLAQFIDQRVAALSDVPTAIEGGVPDMLAYTYNALVAPAQTPAPVVERLSQALREALALPETQEFLQSVAAQPVVSTPAGTIDFMRSEYDKWRPIIRSVGLAME